ncbi:unnamed protein product [Ambrosiozyma monospora]|uniref:Unnamed protein product n=1 Tax=Ambrosiozyma monospora TaxID=43982 RepID=A0A9W6YRY1_AMBMO|nr:unnamed protein product [Ambrosiozyma monospora]
MNRNSIDAITKNLLRDQSRLSRTWDSSDAAELARQLQDEYDDDTTMSIESPNTSYDSSVSGGNQQKTTLRQLVPALFESRLKKIGDPYDINLIIERTLADSKLNDFKTLLSLRDFEEIAGEIKNLNSRKKTLLDNMDTETNPFLKELVSIDMKLKSLQKQISLHYLKVGELGYVNDVLINADTKMLDQNLDSTLETGIEKSLEDLVANVVSLSVQHNIQLPEPDLTSMKTLQGRIMWCTSCITALTNGGVNNDNSAVDNGIVSGVRSSDLRSLKSSTSSPSPRNTNQLFFPPPDSFHHRGESTISSSNFSEDSPLSEYHDLKTKLKDLQFAHTYLTKQYQEERVQYNKSLNSLRFKATHYNEQLITTKTELIKTQSQMSSYDMKMKELEARLKASEDEVLKLTKENNLLKVEHLGEVNGNRNGNNSANNSPHGSTSGINNDGVYSNSSSPKLLPPLSATSMSSDDSNGYSNGNNNNNNSRNSISASILRLEFKKLVHKMNDKFESDLEKERVENQRLQKLVKMYEQKSSHSSSAGTSAPSSRGRK